MGVGKVFKTSVSLPEETLNSLKEIAQKTGTSMAEVLRKAIATEKFLQDTVADGGKILIEDKDKTQKQLLVR
jgi:predicted DNA-binding protein